MVYENEAGIAAARKAYGRVLAGMSAKICLDDPEAVETAAVLPVICTPSEADARVLEHGVTGFFAGSDEEWRGCLEKLINNPALRKRIGTADREFVTREFSIAKTTACYIDFFDQLTEGENGAGDRVVNYGD